MRKYVHTHNLQVMPDHSNHKQPNKPLKSMQEQLKNRWLKTATANGS